MDNKHPHSGASYKILKNDDATFGVEVSIPDSFPTVVSSFPTEAEAERWIAGHQKGIASGESLRRRTFYGARRNS